MSANHWPPPDPTRKLPTQKRSHWGGPPFRVAIAVGVVVLFLGTLPTRQVMIIAAIVGSVLLASKLRKL